MQPLLVYYMDTVDGLSHVGVSHDPRSRVLEHNTLGLNRKGVVRATAKGAGQWQLKLVIGPFYETGSHAFAARLKIATKRHSELSVYVLAMCMAQLRTPALRVVVDNPAVRCREAEHVLSQTPQRLRHSELAFTWFTKHSL
jgi:predicted GIY-YIG superfamily endonuclease